MFDVTFSDTGVFGVCGCNLRSLGCYSKLNRLGMVRGRGDGYEWGWMEFLKIWLWFYGYEVRFLAFSL